MTKIYDVPGCAGCPMLAVHRQRKQEVEAKGGVYFDDNFVPPKPGSSLRLVVAEAPGEEEAIQCEPLVGGSGKRQDAFYRAVGVSRSQLTITNTLSCRPPGNVYPGDPDSRGYIVKSAAEAAIQQCHRQHLGPVLTSRPWERIDILGDKALRVLTGKEGVSDQRGYPVEIPELGNKRIGMPTLHPAYVARDQSTTKAVISDLAKSLTLAPEHYKLYPSLEDVRAFKATTFALDIETRGHSKDITMVGFCAAEYTAICVPFQGAYIPEIKRIVENAENIIGQNLIQFDLPILCEALEIAY